MWKQILSQRNDCYQVYLGYENIDKMEKLQRSQEEIKACSSVRYQRLIDGRTLEGVG